MTELKWDQTGERVYETGVDRGVLYLPDASGVYNDAAAWNGLVSVTESPSGAEPSKQYANNRPYLTLVSAEVFAATLEAFTYPDEFMVCNGEATPAPGVAVGQQDRSPFGLSYRTIIGNDTQGQAYGKKIHLIWGALAAPSEKAFSTINESPEAATFSWELSTDPVEVGVDNLKPTASMTIDSTKVTPAQWSQLEGILYGTTSEEPRLPTPAEVIAIFQGSDPVEVMPVAPTYDSATDTITIPTVTGVEYTIDGEVVSGAVVITEDTLVTARPTSGYRFPAVSDNDWFFDFA